MNNLVWTHKAWQDYLYWQTQDKKTLKKINELVKDIERNGALKGIGKPEVLKNESAYSRRIDEKNRLIHLSFSKFFYLEFANISNLAKPYASIPNYSSSTSIKS